MKRTSNRLVQLLCLMSFLLLLCACEKEKEWGTWMESGLEIDNEGHADMCIVDVFDKEIYDLKELESMAKTEVSDFIGGTVSEENASVSVKEVSRLENDRNQVRLVYHFEKPIFYMNFVDEKLYYETVEQAVTASHLSGNGVFFSNHDSITLDDTHIKKLKRKHVIITDSKTVIRPAYDVLYYSEGVVIRDDGAADTSQCEGLAVIILKK